MSHVNIMKISPKRQPSQELVIIAGPKTRRDVPPGTIIQPPPAELADAVHADIMGGMAAGWRTRAPAAHVEWYGLKEVHFGVWRHKRDRGGVRTTVTLQVPEEREWLPTALERAREHRARLFVIGDAAAQVDEVAARVAQELPQWRRTTLESAYLGSGQ